MLPASSPLRQRPLGLWLSTVPQGSTSRLPVSVFCAGYLSLCASQRRRLNVDGGQKCRGVFLSTNTNEKSAIREFMNLMQQVCRSRREYTRVPGQERGTLEEKGVLPSKAFKLGCFSPRIVSSVSFPKRCRGHCLRPDRKTPADIRLAHTLESSVGFRCRSTSLSSSRPSSPVGGLVLHTGFTSPNCRQAVVRTLVGECR